MNNQPPVIIGSGAPAPMPPHRGGSLSLILIAVLALGTIGFGIAAIAASSKASTATNTLNTAKTTAAAAARTDQKAADDKAAEAAAESPYRAYTAPDAFGGFVINFPKNWNVNVVLSDSDTDQVAMTLEPDFVRTINGVVDAAPARIDLYNRSFASCLTNLANKKALQAPFTVSGIAGIQLTGAAGTLSDKRAARIVVIPVRDKCIAFTNEDASFNGVFDTILAQAKVNP